MHLSLRCLIGIFYSIYLLLVKSLAIYIDVLSFMMISLLASCVFYLAIVCIKGTNLLPDLLIYWLVLVLQAIVCQLMAWLSISYATQQYVQREFPKFTGAKLFWQLFCLVILDEKLQL
jgi:drug/metabolite transporter (DMT)-like permease